MSSRTCFISLTMLCMTFGCTLRAAEDPVPKSRRFSAGFRIQSLPSHPFVTKNVETSTTTPVAYYTYTGTSGSSTATVGPVAEYRLWTNLSLCGEFRFHKVEFQQVTTMKSGERDPNSVSDDRMTTTINQTNKADYWEFPLLVRYQGLYPSGWWRKAYVSAGVELRHVGRVRTGTSFSYADGATDYNETATSPARQNQVGFVVGVGLSLVNHWRVINQVTPEIRYVRWQGSTFDAPVYRSRSSQVEAGIGFTF